jgi:hypothetical protein
MLVSLVRDPFGSSRLPQAFAEVGLRTAVVCEPGSLLAKSRFVDSFFPISVFQTRLGHIDPIVKAIETYSPAVVLPVDDGAACLLTNIAKGRGHAPPAIVRLLQASLGNLEQADIRLSRHRIRDLAGQCGIRASRGKPVQSPAEVIDFADQFGWPVVVKSEGSAGGSGVRVCQSPSDLTDAFKQISTPPLLTFSPRKLASLIGALIQSRCRLVGDLTIPSDFGSTSVESYVAGRPAYCTVLAQEGQMLAALSLEAIRTNPAPQGPSSIVRAIDCPLMEDAAGRLVAQLGFSGYCGLDFIIEEKTGLPYFLEFNPRATQIVHLGSLFGVDLCGALSCALNGTAPPKPGPLVQTSIALVPQDLRRDPGGLDRPADIIDIPMDDPDLLAALSAYFPPGAVVPASRTIKRFGSIA